MILSGLASPAELQGAVRDAMVARRLALNMTQVVLAARSGVSLDSLRRFERIAEISLASLVRLAMALDCADGLSGLFPAPEMRRLDDLIAKPAVRRRARRKG